MFYKQQQQLTWKSTKNSKAPSCLVGRDSMLVMSMSNFQKYLSTLCSAPGWSCSSTRMDVRESATSLISYDKG